MAPEVIMQEYGALADEWSVGQLSERILISLLSEAACERIVFLGNADISRNPKSCQFVRLSRFVTTSPALQ